MLVFEHTKEEYEMLKLKQEIELMEKKRNCFFLVSILLVIIILILLRFFILQE